MEGKLEKQVQELIPLMQSLPKIELHAHINGCVRDETLEQLLQESGEPPGPDAHLLLRRGQRTLEECFDIFAAIHRLTTRLEAVRRITAEVVNDFRADGVVYLELRTTPKHNAEKGITKRSYCEAVLAGIGDAACGPSGGDGTGPITVRLLLSIDRRETAEAAAETVALAVELARGGIVVGVDLSGNPTLGAFSTWAPALEAARRAGLRLSLHCGEVPNRSEVLEMLSFRPERLGHASTAANSDEELRAALVESAIPVELCLTSNVLSGTVPDFGDHHLRDLRAAGHPLCLCTDDSGVFQTTLSREFALAAASFCLDGGELWSLSSGALLFIFAGAAVEAALRSTHFGRPMQDAWMERFRVSGASPASATCLSILGL